MDASLNAARAAHLAQAERHKAAFGRGLRLVATAVLLALGLRSFVYQPFNIPSESMLPGLLVGDYLLVAKWPYGVGRFSLPFDVPLPARFGGTLPARGDIIVFKTPRDNRTDFIKRVIGLPGDRVAMRDGLVVLNGVPLPQHRHADFIVDTAGMDCSSGPDRPDFRAPGAHGRCRYPAFDEALGGRRWVVLDQIAGDLRDTTATVTVPPGHVFVLGDNRDDSADSRFGVAEGGVGMVPVGNIIGRADRVYFSVRPGVANPLDWIAAIRRDRIGLAL